MKKQYQKRTALFGMVVIAIAALPGCQSPTSSSSGYGDYECVKNILGRGYDVFGNYADPDGTKSAILNFDALYNDGKLIKYPKETTEFKTVSGTSASEYSSNLAASLNLSGSYKFFSGKVKAAFSSTRAASSYYQYATIQATVDKDAYVVSDRTSASDLKKYLTTQFSTDLNGTDLSPEQLFVKYGTHVMTGVVMGGRLDYNLSAHNGSSSSTETISLYAEAKYKNKYTKSAATMETSASDTEASSTSFTDVATTTKAQGGESTDSVGNSDDNFGAWLKSVNSNPVFCDYCTDSLTPIYELCDTDTDAHKARQTAIEEALSTWSENRYAYYIGETPMGTLTVSTEELYNEDTGDNSGSAEWVWQPLVYSSFGKFTYTISQNTDASNAVSCGERDAITNIAGTTTIQHIPVQEADTFITITPCLEESDDHMSLGHSTKEDDPNELYCIASGGPHFTFNLDPVTKSWTFSGSSGRTGYSTSAISTTRSDTRDNADVTVPLGESRTFYIIMRTINDCDDWVSIRMTIRWTLETS